MSFDQRELESLTLRDPLSWGISFIDLGDGKKWEVGNRTWLPEIYKVVNPWVIEKYPIGQAKKMTVVKPTQIGMSTMGMIRMFHFLVNWPVRVMYTLPRQLDVLDFTTTRLDPTISLSPILGNLLGKPDSAHAKRIGNSFVYIAEMSVEPRMLPIDALFNDEIDLSDLDHVATSKNRMDASRWKLEYRFSTPTLPNYGIHAMYHESDMRKWIIRCPRCNTEQTLEWEQNLRIVGAHNNPEKVFFGCVRCNNEITHEIIQQGRWIAEKPDRSKDHIGFQLSQMMTHPPKELYSSYRDPQVSIIEFYRKRLGTPYEIGGGSVTREDILVNCFNEPYRPEPMYDGKSKYYMGVDQGNELQVLICKIEPETRHPKIVHIELIPMEKGFDRVGQLFKLFHIKRGVIDANPNRHDAVKLTNDFPGKMIVADYAEQKNLWTTKKGNKKNYTTNVTINRTSGFDSLFDSIKNEGWQLPGKPPKLHPDVELVIDHVTSLKRDIEIRRTASGEISVAVYRKLRADHLAHAWLYMHIACLIDKGRETRIAVIGKEEEEEEEEEQSYRPKDDVIIGITTLLAEVPKEQLSKFLEMDGIDPSYERPFPLSYKMGKVEKERYEYQDIEWVIENLINQKKRKSPPYIEKRKHSLT